MPGPTRSRTPMMNPRRPMKRPDIDISPEAERDDVEDMVRRRREMEEMTRENYTREEAGAIERGNRAARRRAEQDVELMEFKDGGMVRGCKAVQTTGKGFKGTF